MIQRPLDYLAHALTCEKAGRRCCSWSIISRSSVAETIPASKALVSNYGNGSILPAVVAGTVATVDVTFTGAALCGAGAHDRVSIEAVISGAVGDVIRFG